MDKRVWLLAVLAVWGSTAIAQFRNFQISQPVDGKSQAVEPTVVINPANPSNIIAAAGKDRIMLSRDGGAIWLETYVTSSFGMSGDPVLVADSKGTVFYFHLADPSGQGKSSPDWLDRIVSQRSIDGGVVWTSGTYMGLQPPKDNDKPAAAAHPKKEMLAVTWTQFDRYGSDDPNCQSNILFSRSSNKGDKWSEPVRVNKMPGTCLDNDFTAMGAAPYIDLDGRIFVAWAQSGKIYLDRSFDEGTTWLRSDISVAQQLGGWDLTVPGLGRCNGLPALKGDHSTGPYRTSLYVTFSDQRFGENDTDIWFIKSPNRGDNWSDPVRVNGDGPGRHQFLPAMAVDPSSGYIYLVYYDRRAYPADDLRTDVYVAWSEDGGNSFRETKISETPFIPNPLHFFGDYIGITAHQGTIVPVWTRMDNGTTSIWSSVFRLDDLRSASK